jgi:ferritin-like metal-binding protein YciE
MFGTMKIDDLKDLYLDELKDVYDAQHQIIDALDDMARAAHAPELKSALSEHRRQNDGQVRRIEQVFESLGERPDRKTCKGIKGVIAEGRDYVKAKGDPATIDAALISTAQRVEHYEIAAFGTLRTYARVLGHPDQAALLQQNLDQAVQTDRRLTQLAESGINVEAAVAVGV